MLKSLNMHHKEMTGNIFTDVKWEKVVPNPKCWQLYWKGSNTRFFNRISHLGSSCFVPAASEDGEFGTQPNLCLLRRDWRMPVAWMARNSIFCSMPDCSSSAQWDQAVGSQNSHTSLCCCVPPVTGIGSKVEQMECQIPSLISHYLMTKCTIG